LIAEASREVDPAARLGILRRAEDLLVQQAVPIAPVYYYVGIQLYDPDKIGGIRANVLDEHPIRAINRK
jgi:ABC-type oligopeptide transport system substrate-binding subunit